MSVNIYRVAQRLLSIDPALPEMALRRVDDPVPSNMDPSNMEPATMDPATECRESTSIEPVFRGDGQLGPVQRHIDCRWSQHGYSLQVDGVGHFLITGDGRRISRNEPIAHTVSSEAPPEQLTETVLGPAMTLALGLQGVWCLHAGAVEYGGEVVAFLGPSGAGKSTLGRELPRLDPDLRCAADDVLPVAFDDADDADDERDNDARDNDARDYAAVHALPRFPQLKYELDHQPGDALPASLPLRRIYILDPTRDEMAELSAEPLAGTAAVLALVRHTVAAKLFTKELLKRHMDFCVRLAKQVEIHRLVYPHRPESLGQARELLFPHPSKCCS